MPTCSSQVALRPLLHFHVHSGPRPRLRLVLKKRNAACARRAYAAAAAAVRQQQQSSLEITSPDATANLSLHDSKARILTLLHKTAGLLSRVLPSRTERVDGPALAESEELWRELLDATRDEMGRITDGNLRVVIYGYDQFSGAKDLVNALVEDPFLPDLQKEAIRNRWQGRTSPLVLQYSPAGVTMAADSNTLKIPSSWLQRFPSPISIYEYSSSDFTESSQSSSSLSIAKSLFTADIPIIVLNPLSSPLPTVLSSSVPPLPITHPHAVFVLTSTPSSQPPYLGDHPARIRVIDPQRALTAIHTLAANPGSAVAVQRYQDDFIASGLSSASEVIEEVLSTSSTDPSVPLLVALRLRKAQYIAKNVLAASETALGTARKEVDDALATVSEIQGRIEEARVRYPREVLGVDDGGDVVEAVKKAKKEVAVTMDGLRWWKMMWRVDDIRHIVGAAVERAWCRDLERKLIFHTGNLAALQHAMIQSTTEALSSFPPSSALHSPLLNNSIAQLTTSPCLPLHPTALTTPLHKRLVQLAYPTARLHSAAQRSVLVMSSSVLGGAGIAWAVWIGHIGIFEIGMGMGVESAVGAGLLGALAGVRWAIGHWERAKRKWWKDWDRVGEGLERDLKAVLNEILEEQVLAVPKEASEGLEVLAERRKELIEELRDETGSLTKMADLQKV